EYCQVNHRPLWAIAYWQSVSVFILAFYRLIALILDLSSSGKEVRQSTERLTAIVSDRPYALSLPPMPCIDRLRYLRENTCLADVMGVLFMIPFFLVYYPALYTYTVERHGQEGVCQHGCPTLVRSCASSLVVRCPVAIDTSRRAPHAPPNTL